MVMLIFPEISNIFWLWERFLGFCILHCYSVRDREGEFQWASKWSVGCPCSVFLGAGDAGWGRWDAALLFCEKTCQAKIPS